MRKSFGQGGRAFPGTQGLSQGDDWWLGRSSPGKAKLFYAALRRRQGQRQGVVSMSDLCFLDFSKPGVVT